MSLGKQISCCTDMVFWHFLHIESEQSRTYCSRFSLAQLTVTLDQPL